MNRQGSSKRHFLQQIELNGNWRFRPANTPNRQNLPPDFESPDAWLSASVPGTVHTDLLNAGRIPDPFYRDNEKLVQWVDLVDWEYHREFVVSPDFLDAERIELVCEGLDTFATIIVNGQQLAHTRNMFLSYRFDVKPFLHPGQNEIRIVFEAPTVKTKAMEAEFGQLLMTHETYRVYCRKAQYSFGWDWGPSLPTSGIWRPIYLEARKMLRITNAWVQVAQLAEKSAQLLITATIDKYQPGAIEYHLTIECQNQRLTPIQSSDATTLNFQMEIKNPELWWPHGYGDQPLYNMTLQAIHEGQIIDEFKTCFGLRNIELQQIDEKGQPRFIFKINGMPVFCKGANWIPADSFLPRIPPEKYAQLLNMAKEAHINMLRVWGGGIYEAEIFYHLCNQLGIMVWQDFMFACGGYPDEKWFESQVKEEAIQVIQKLRNHPSVVLWCGNNENEWIWSMKSNQPVEQMPGYSIFHHLLPELCRHHDPSRPYWPTSPWGGEEPNSETKGDHHQWRIWSDWQDYTEVLKNHGCFISEFGFQAPANVSTLDKVTVPQDRSPQSKIFEFHNKQIEGTERLFRFLAGHFKVETDYQKFIHRCQINQAEALKYCVEHWRRRKFETAGTLIWQLNDCWPASSWSIIDSELEPKAAYYYCRRFFAPLLITCFPEKNDLEIWMVNDYLKEFNGVVELKVQTFTGELLLAKRCESHIPANQALRVTTIHNDEIAALDSSNCYLRMLFTVKEKVLTENSFLFTRFKYLNLPSSKPAIQLLTSAEEKVILTISADRFVKGVAIYTTRRGQLSDNYFDLHPGAPKSIIITTPDAREWNPSDITMLYL